MHIYKHGSRAAYYGFDFRFYVDVGCRGRRERFELSGKKEYVIIFLAIYLDFIFSIALLEASLESKIIHRKQI